MNELIANSGDPDHSAAADLGLHSLPITLLGVSRLQWLRIDILIGTHNITMYILIGKLEKSKKKKQTN